MTNFDQTVLTFRAPLFLPCLMSQVRHAAYDVLRCTVWQPGGWGLSAVFSQPGFRTYLESRETEVSKVNRVFRGGCCETFRESSRGTNPRICVCKGICSRSIAMAVLSYQLYLDGGTKDRRDTTYARGAAVGVGTLPWLAWCGRSSWSVHESG